MRTYAVDITIGRKGKQGDMHRVPRYVCTYQKNFLLTALVVNSGD